MRKPVLTLGLTEKICPSVTSIEEIEPLGRSTFFGAAAFLVAGGAFFASTTGLLLAAAFFLGAAFFWAAAFFGAAAFFAAAFFLAAAFSGAAFFFGAAFFLAAVFFFAVLELVDFFFAAMARAYRDQLKTRSVPAHTNGVSLFAPFLTQRIDFVRNRKPGRLSLMGFPLLCTSPSNYCRKVGPTTSSPSDTAASETNTVADSLPTRTM